MESKPRLAIVGASARAAAFCALDAGYDVVAADLFADADLAARCPVTRIDNYPAGLMGWLATQEVDAWMYTGALENHPTLIDRMAAIKPLWGNWGDALRRVRDPLRLQAALSEAGLSFPKTLSSGTTPQSKGSWLSKTYRGANGSGVQRPRGEQLDVGYVQQLISGVCASVTLMLDDDPRVIAVTRQLVGLPEFGAAEFSYCGTLPFPGDLEVVHWVKLKLLRKVLHEQFGLRGLVGVDVMFDEEKIWVLEVNPRFTSSMEVVTSKASLLALHARCFGGKPTSTNRVGDTPAAKAILFAKDQVEIDASFFDWAMAQASEGFIADIPRVGSVIEVGQPILTLLESDGTPGSLQRLRHRASKIYNRLVGTP